MAVNSRSKGAKNEKAAAGVIAKWTKKKFARAPTNNFIHKRNADNSKGDIICITEGHYFPFCIELKSYNKIDFSHLLLPNIKNVDILDFWAQVTNDANKAGKIPMLMMRYNGLPKDFWFLGIPSDFYAKLPMLPRMSNCTKTLKYWDTTKDIKITILPSTDFFRLPYKEIKSLAKKILKENGKRN